MQEYSPCSAYALNHRNICLSVQCALFVFCQLRMPRMLVTTTDHRLFCHGESSVYSVKFDLIVRPFVQPRLSITHIIFSVCVRLVCL